MIFYWLNRIADRLDDRANSLMNQDAAEALRAIAEVLRELYRQEG